MNDASINLESILIEPGTRDDYEALAKFHYRPGQPRVITCIFRALHDAPTIVDRALGRREAIAARTVGVLVVARPRLGSASRDLATGSRYRGLSRAHQAAMINREVRTINRVIVHPQFRGLGIAVGLVGHALATAETIYTEALAAMGRVCPFFERAGMTRFDAPPNPEHSRLIDALHHVGLPPSSLASPEVVERHLAKLSPGEREFLHCELVRLHMCVERLTRRDNPVIPIDALLAGARRRLLSQPVYYLFRAGGRLGDQGLGTRD